VRNDYRERGEREREKREKRKKEKEKESEVESLGRSQNTFNHHFILEDPAITVCEETSFFALPGRSLIEEIVSLDNISEK